ncbi:MAG: hypothetical protein R3A46_04275 [Thermomicrobiales bacterium]
MERSKRQEHCRDEPAVTFELEETPQDRSRSRLGAAGAAAVTGAGLISSGATPEFGDTLDVFDQAETPDAATGEVPTTSFEELGGEDPEFPPIDFEGPVDETIEDAAPWVSTGEESDATFGATSDVGGGYALEDIPDNEAFGAADAEIDVELVPDALVDHDGLGDDADVDADELHDIDLT